MGFKTGHKPWNKEKRGVYSEETRKKMADRKRGKVSPKRRKISAGDVFGKLLVIREINGVKRKQGGIRRRFELRCECGNYVNVLMDNFVKRNHTVSCGCVGKENRRTSLWKGGITPLNHTIRSSFLYRQWVSDCMHRDDFTCTICYKRGTFLHVHHIKEFHTIMEEYQIKNKYEADNCPELWDLNNGITLCRECHFLIHGLNKKLKCQK